MIYIIDANNLAGKIGILKEKAFDKILINNIHAYFLNKKNEIYLVFDSADPYGDKYKEDNIIIIYAPKNELYRNADDKIINLFQEKIVSEKIKEEISLITDDNEIIEEVLKISEKENKKINIISASSFAEKFIDNNDSEIDFDNFEDRGINSRDKENINQALLDFWGSK